MESFESFVVPLYCFKFLPVGGWRRAYQGFLVREAESVFWYVELDLLLEAKGPVVNFSPSVCDFGQLVYYLRVIFLMLLKN